MRGVWLETLTWPEAKDWFDRGSVVVVPIGAVSKEHGHHLPMKTDYLYAEALSKRLAEALPVVIAPIISFGYYPAFVGYPGSQHLRSSTFSALLTDILGKLAADGVKRLVVLNTGVSTEPVLRVVVRDLYEATGLAIHTVDIRMLGQRTRKLLAQKYGGHADESETSVMLAVAPDLVRLERAREDYGHMLELPRTVFYRPSVFKDEPGSGEDYSATGVRGDPRAATAAKGEAILDDMTEEMIAGLKAIFPEAFE
jgi:creatinine amidohydrolase